MTKFFFAILLVSQASMAKSIEESWDDTNINFSFVENYISNYNCFSRKAAFRACMEAVNRWAQKSDKHFSFATPQRIAQTIAPYEFIPLAQPSPLSVNSRIIPCTVKQIATDVPVKDHVRANYQQWDVLFDDLSVGFKSDKDMSNGLLDFDFNRITAMMKKSAIKKYGLAEIVNIYLMTLDDPHHHLIPASYVNDQRNESDEKFVGIGVQIQGSPKGAYVTRIYDKTPASENLRVDDLILKVDGQPVAGLEAADVGRLIRGPKDTTVQLNLLRNGGNWSIKIKRAEFKTLNQELKLLSIDGDTFGQIIYRSFSGSEDCKKMSDKIRDNDSKIKAWILDLRDNGGGDSEIAQCLAGLFLGQEVVYETQEIPAGRWKIYGAEYQGDLSKSTHDYFKPLTLKPMVVLINSQSASAAELLAGTLKEHNRALILGERSYGKGTVQGVLPLAGHPDILEYATYKRFYLPSGESNQLVGVTPHLEVAKTKKGDQHQFDREEDLFVNYILRDEETGFALTKALPVDLSAIKSCLVKNPAQNLRTDWDYQLRYSLQTFRCADKTGFEMPFAPQQTWTKLKRYYGIE